ncbi:MAG: pilus assembly protein [Herbaspirillum sp.]|jgi:type IV pilus assembly protein PilX|nr:pilus assembly protein [Herbaspirillum sp.]
MRAKWRYRRQQGAALVIALLMLIVLLMLGLGAMRISLLSQKMGRHQRDRQIAWQAAEAALADAEYTIGATDAGIDAGIGDIAYGKYSGRTMQTGVGILPAHRPRYRIEILPRTEDDSRLFRISAVGFGPGENTRVLLQSIYRRAPQSGAARSGRLSWREISASEPE